MILPAHTVLKHDGKALGALEYHLSTHEMAIIGTYILFNIGFLCGVYTSVMLLIRNKCCSGHEQICMMCLYKLQAVKSHLKIC